MNCDLVLGVPQGSVLSSLLFLIYIDDLSIELSITLLADDTSISIIGNTMDDVISLFKLRMEIVLNCIKFNQLSVNWSKTKIMFITKKRRIVRKL